MPSASYSKLQIETGQTVVDFTALNGVGEGVYIHPVAKVWSKFAGNEPEIFPDGLATGGKILPAESGDNDVVSVAALTAYIGGQMIIATNGNQTLSRPSTSTHKIVSLALDNAGNTSLIDGVEGSAFADARGEAGAPPFIPVGKIELGQVRLSAQTTAPIAAADILTNPGQHTERYDYPIFGYNTVGDKDNPAFVRFSSVLPQIHSDDDGSTVAAKGIYAKVSTPIFTDIDFAADFKPCETTHSSSSTPVYMGKSVNSSSTTLTQGGFTAYLKNGVTDVIVKLKDNFLTYRYYPNQYQSAHHIVQGLLGVGRSFPAAGNISAACTITADFEGVDRAS